MSDKPRKWVWISEKHVFDNLDDYQDAFPNAGFPSLFPTRVTYNEANTIAIEALDSVSTLERVLKAECAKSARLIEALEEIKNVIHKQTGKEPHFIAHNALAAYFQTKDGEGKQRD